MKKESRNYWDKKSGGVVYDTGWKLKKNMQKDKVYPHKWYDDKGNFVPCPKRNYHHLGSTCQYCGQKD